MSHSSTSTGVKLEWHVLRSHYFFLNSNQAHTYSDSLFAQLTSDATTEGYFEAISGAGLPKICYRRHNMQRIVAEQEAKRILKNFLHDLIYLLDLFLNHWCFQGPP